MPDMTPVGNTVIPPNPMAGINSYSGMLGIRQQQQALQTGAYQQQSAQAGANQDQQKDRELQAAQALALNGAKSGQYTKPDGSLDRQKMADDISQVAPTYGQPVASSLLSQANEVVQNQKAHFELSSSKRNQMGETFAALAGDPDVDNTKVVDAFNELSETMKDPEERRMLFSMATHLPPNAKAADLQALMGKWSAAATGKPQVAPGQMDTGTQIQPGATNQFSGQFTPAGQPINKQSVVTTPAGPLAVATPARGTVSPLTTAGPPGQGGGAPQPELNVTTAQATTQNTAAQGVAGRVQQAQAAANNTVQAQDSLTRARAILDQPGSPNTGALFEWKRNVKNFLSTAGIDTSGADDTNTLVKNLARYEASRATQAGLGGTDAARELAHNGSPNVSLDNAALKGIVTQSLATEKALSTYANVQAKTKDAGALAKNEADFRSIPNLVQGYEYGLARTPAEAEEFLKKHGLTRAEMATTRQKIKEFEGR